MAGNGLPKEIRRRLYAFARGIASPFSDSRRQRFIGDMIPGLLISGFFLWYGERDTRFRLANALLVHDYLMYASLILFIGHLWFALILPKTRHSLNGITRGWVREDWARKRHPAWVEELGESGEA